jgi:hypothetical protein
LKYGIPTCTSSHDAGPGTINETLLRKIGNAGCGIIYVFDTPAIIEASRYLRPYPSAANIIDMDITEPRDV